MNPVDDAVRRLVESHFDAHREAAHAPLDLDGLVDAALAQPLERLSTLETAFADHVHGEPQEPTPDEPDEPTEPEPEEPEPEEPNEPGPVTGAGLLGINVMSLPDSGPAFARARAMAQGSLGTANVDNAEGRHAALTLNAAVVGVRTDDAALIAKARDGLIAASRTESDDALHVSRQMVGYFMAADLLRRHGNPMPAAWDTWAAMQLNRDHGYKSRGTYWNIINSLTNNYGTMALQSEIAGALYFGDTARVARSAEALKWYLGHETNWRPASMSMWNEAYWRTWACNPNDPMPPMINANCGSGKDGAWIIDISRPSSRYPEIGGDGLMYTWECMQGVALSLLMLRANGYPDCVGWGDNALLRATRFAERVGSTLTHYGTHHWIPWLVEHLTGATFDGKREAGLGRQLAHADYLFGKAE